MESPPPELTDFEKFLKEIWPFSYPPSGMKEFCKWYEMILNRVTNLSIEEKGELRKRCIQTWVNLNICEYKSKMSKSVVDEKSS